MQTSKPDILAKVQLIRTCDGGRTERIPAVQFGCPLIHNNQAFDCRLLLDQLGEGIDFGDEKIVPIKFLFPNNVKNRLKEGDSILLWEGKYIAFGVITQIF